MKVLILGGAGVFGGRVARLLAEDGHAITVAGRDAARTATFATAHGLAPLTLDASDDAALRTALAGIAPDLVIDAAGPFQGYTDARAARAALECGAHYLDLSDDARFTAAIGALDALARSKGRTALSGVSSVPALSSAAAAWGADGLRDTGLIASAILPGNRAPRGRSVMAAILTQAGAPVPLWRGGRVRPAPGWSGRTTITLGPGLARPAAVIGAPDLALFPAAFSARSVVFRAGLELGLLHHGLGALAALRRAGLLPDPARFTRILHWLAQRFEGFGSDRGGMQVVVEGRLPDGTPRRRTWTLVAQAGDGPWIPAIPARLATAALVRDGMLPGARPALQAFTLEEAEAALAAFDVRTARADAPAPRLFEAALGPRWPALPPEIRSLHDLWDLHATTGRATVTRGSHPLARLVAALFRFPRAGADVPVTVTMERLGETERWTRDFAGRRFTSRLSAAGPGRVTERFGPFAFDIALTETPGGFGMEVRRGRFLGVPLPRPLLPRSETAERVENGRFTFDVRLSLPVGGLLVHYRGWLVPDA